MRTTSRLVQPFQAACEWESSRVGSSPLVAPQLDEDEGGPRCPGGGAVAASAQSLGLPRTAADALSSEERGIVGGRRCGWASRLRAPQAGPSLSAGSSSKR